MNDVLIIIGGGSSIGNFNFHLLDDYTTFGLNFVYQLYKPTVILWVDKEFYNNNKLSINNCDSLKITKICDNLPKNIIQLPTSKKYIEEDCFSLGVYDQFLVGLFSLTIGIELGFKNIFLLGYDGKFINNKSHFHNIEHRGKYNEKGYLRGNLMFDVYKNCKSKIFNVSINSAINTFEKITYENFIDLLKSFKTINQNEIKKIILNKIIS